MQPVVIAPDGYIRFQGNALVRHLLDEATAGRKCDLNDLAMVEAPRSDREQFAQLIGYSLSGFSELSYVRDATYDRAVKRAEKLRAGKGAP